MPPINLKTDISNLRRDSNAVAKMLDQHDVFSKQQSTQIKKLLNQIIIVLNSVSDSKVDRKA